ncbi:hypothetical protein [Marinomonas sp. THO17]|uniref:hypothetical protein n=1 Tax=Marinomonas sp. THO17 TaxID=3149048 RepID=UPI00336BC26C
MKYPMQSLKNTLLTCSFLLTGLLLVACSTPYHTTDLPAPDIKGSYTDNYNYSQDIEAKQWIINNQSVFVYQLVNNAESYLTAKNSSANPYYPDKFSRFEWTHYFGDIWYCQQVYDASTAANANNFTIYPKADSSNPATGGCGLNGHNFPWSKLIPN